MNRITLLQFLPIYALLVVSLGLCMYLFLSAKREIRRLQLRLKQQNMLLQEAYDRMEFSVEQLKTKLQGADEKAVAQGTATAVSGMTLSKRTLAARMFRKGEGPEQIASALGLPQNEVALLWKVHQASTS
jgi:ABC-type tungstate transport system substrate-binding protein